MINRIKSLFISLAILQVSFLAYGLLVPSAVALAADSKQAVCEGAGVIAAPNTIDCSAEAKGTVQTVLRTALNLFSAIIGIIAVVMIIIAGLKYITSQGEPANIATAKNSIIYAAIGLVVVALAQVIVRFVLNRFS
jgi:Type IV secretion system pilin